MSKEELIRKLSELQSSGDTEQAHSDADDLLVEYINDAEISEAYNAIDKWFA